MQIGYRADHSLIEYSERILFLKRAGIF